ncbi:MAG: hypothetical protein NTZ02_04230 [Candidatus Woesearchaeota archaeon]|nr:hypothetical protein [Candidatus Woesearchaeota archaeon]
MISYLKRKILPCFLAGALALGTVAGCKDIHTEISNVLHEDATVVMKTYTPERFETEVVLRAIGGPTGVGMDYNGNVGMGVRNMQQMNTIWIREEYAVVFQCQDRTFEVKGSERKNKNLYDKLQEGQDVDVTYKEAYRVTYDDIDGDGKKDLVQRVLIDFYFLDANPKED